MKIASLSNRIAVASVFLFAAVTASAGGGGMPHPDRSISHSVSASMVEQDDASAAPADAVREASYVASAGAVSGKSREQVRAELVQAGEAGLLPVHGFDYPPSAATIARNRVYFLRLEQAWERDGSISTAAK